MKYSHNYSKLLKIRYTTIRRYTKGKIGDVIKETYPAGEHHAEIFKIERKALNGIHIDLLKKDTDLSTRLEIYALFQSFYMKIIDFNKEKFYIYYLKKVFK